MIENEILMTTKNMLMTTKIMNTKETMIKFLKPDLKSKGGNKRKSTCSSHAHLDSFYTDFTRFVQSLLEMYPIKMACYRK